MCGIAGVWGLSGGRKLLDSTGNSMIAAIAHRGPDSGGVWVNDDCCIVLGHRRLSIQDLTDSGAQPMLSKSGRYCVVFNGEIYNFQELAEELSGWQIQFTGHSDTEVLLAAIEVWGLEKALQRFNGMFAFAVWDNKTDSLHLCRDRMGEKPLYYGWINNAFYFASELKALEAVIPSSELRIDSKALELFFRYGYIGAPKSIYQSVQKLPPATMITITQPDGQLDSNTPVCYWNLSQVARSGIENQITNEEEAIGLFEKTLTGTIRRQLVADVDVGLFLSGGIDSSLVSALAQKESKDKIRTYTIGFGDTEFNEAGFAGKVAQHLGTEHLTIPVTAEDAVNMAPEISSIYDEPFADSSQIPTFIVSKLARQHVTVCLSGDGGDELFAGYNRYLWTDSLWKKLAILPTPLRKLVGNLLGKPSVGFWDHLYGLMKSRAKDKEEMRLVGLKMQKLSGFMQQKDLVAAYNFLLSYWHEPGVLLKGLDTGLGKVQQSSSVFDGSFVNSAMLLDQSEYLPGDNLAKVDRASMAVALETRLPLLNHEIVELAWRVPLSMKVREQTSKWIMRQVLYKYVPQELIDRPKMGFSVPVASWLRAELKEWAGDMIDSIDSIAGDHIDSNQVRIKWKEHLSGQYDHSHRLWAVLMFISWMEKRVR